MCLHEIAGHEYYIKKKVKLNNKINTIYFWCRYKGCSKHRQKGHDVLEWVWKL